LPYQSQVVALAAVLLELGNDAEQIAVKQRVKEWFWCGVFGELYGSSTETRVSKDFLEVPAWARGNGDTPTTVVDAQFRADRLNTMRSRLSAAYKGVNILLMQNHAKDWRTGDLFADAFYFEDHVDIHHIFPRKWCESQKIPKPRFDSIVNKTPLARKTNIILGGHAPSFYLQALTNGSNGHTAVPQGQLRELVMTHHIDYDLLNADNFDDFMAARKEALLSLITNSMGKDADLTTDEDGQFPESEFDEDVYLVDSADD
jgi:hypothetical protein